jgi:hypothetical protein
MQDKSFLQAIEDLQDRISSNFQESINHMLVHHTSATDATSDIKDEKVREAVADALINGQIISLLALMKDLQLLDTAQYDEFTAYLQQALIAQHCGFTLSLESDLL